MNGSERDSTRATRITRVNEDCVSSIVSAAAASEGISLVNCGSSALGKLVTEKPVNFVDFDSVVKFNKNRQNDDNVVKAYKS